LRMELIYLRAEIEARGRTFAAGTAGHAHEIGHDMLRVALPDEHQKDAYTFEVELPRDAVERSGASFDW
jgi:hypothetical protein